MKILLLLLIAAAVATPTHAESPRSYSVQGFGNSHSNKPPLRAKVIHESHADALEGALNAWLEGHPNAEVIEVRQSESRGPGFSSFTVVIFYREGPPAASS